MLSFNIRLETERGILTFYCNPHGSNAVPSYLVSCTDWTNKTQIFYMTVTSFGWSFKDPTLIPHWLTSVENQLADALARHDMASGSAARVY